jgi:hypothetical protein
MKNDNELNLAGYSALIITALFIAMSYLTELKAQSPRNCSEIHFSNPSAPSGIYTIDPDGNGPLPSIDCQCDMTTDGGGWTLVMNYNHLANSNPALKVFTDSLPLQGQTVLGIDESNTIYWGHAGVSMMTAIPFDEVRFYGYTTDHNRVMNFKTSHTGTISYFKTGMGSTEGISTNYTPLDGHTTNLPAAINMTVTNMGDYAMTAYPLWTGSTYHWYLGGSDPLCTQRWEVDNYPCTTPSTFHQIWVRQNASLGINSMQQNRIEMNLSPNPFSEVTKLTLFNMRSEEIDDIQINFYNLLGIQVFPIVIRESEAFSIGKGSLQAGVYYCQIANGTEVLSTTKMVIK